MARGERTPTVLASGCLYWWTFTNNNAITEGRYIVIGVMEKDPDRFPETEGWGFEDFKFTDGGPERQVTDARTQCMSCHKPQKASDYVYSAYRK